MDADLGLFLLRLALGPMLVLHGWNKAFGAGGLAGTEGWFRSLGLRPAWFHARAAAANEVVAGLLLTIGLLTPVACAAFVGLMLVATLTDHRGKGYFVFKGGWEYTVLVAVIAVGIAALGPGSWSVDDAAGLEWHGAGWAAAALGVGVTAAALLLATCYRPDNIKSAEPALAPGTE